MGVFYWMISSLFNLGCKNFKIMLPGNEANLDLKGFLHTSIKKHCSFYTWFSKHILSADSQQTLSRLLANSQQTLSRLSANSQKTLSKLSANSQQTLSKLSANSQQTFSTRKNYCYAYSPPTLNLNWSMITRSDIKQDHLTFTVDWCIIFASSYQGNMFSLFL